MSGWIKLHRKLLKSRAWCGADAEGKVILITLLLTACHSVTHWQITTDKNAVLNPGELFISYRRFAKSCGVSLKKLTSEFNRLAVVGFLECKSKREGTIVRIKTGNAISWRIHLWIHFWEQIWRHLRMPILQGLPVKILPLRKHQREQLWVHLWRHITRIIYY